jgi:hypothetical protein
VATDRFGEEAVESGAFGRVEVVDVVHGNELDLRALREVRGLVEDQGPSLDLGAKTCTGHDVTVARLRDRTRRRCSAGRETTLREYLVGTVRRLGGSGLSDFDRDALAAYVSTVRPPVVSRGAHAAVERGSSIFHSPSVGCSGCHRSDTVFADGDQHAIGSETPADRTYLFDTPSLRFVGGTPPYFHRFGDEHQRRRVRRGRRKS